LTMALISGADVSMPAFELQMKMVLFHIAAIGWISPQTGYEIQGSISTQN